MASRELRETSRGRVLFLLRSLYGLSLAFVAIVSFRRGGPVSVDEAGQVTADLFTGFSVFQPLAAVVVGAVLGVATVRAELREKTLGLLVLSGFRSREIVTGKAAALAGLLGAVLLAALPVFALLAWGGGLDHSWLAALALVSAAFAALGVSTGLLAGVLFRSGFGAAALVGTISAGLVAPLWVFDGHPPAPMPVWAIVVVATQGRHAPGAPFLRWHLTVPLLVLFGVSLLFLALSAVLLEWSVGRTAGLGLRGAFEALDRHFERLNRGGVVFGKEKALRSNPVAWLARTAGGLGRPRYLVRLLLPIAAVAVSAGVGLLDERRSQGILATLFVAFVVGFPTLLAAVGGAAVAGERQRRTLLPLLATPLPARTILAGKMRGFAAPLLVVSALLLAIPMALVSHGAEREARFLGADLLASGLLGYALSLLASLRARSAVRAAVAGLGAGFLFWCALGWALDEAGAPGEELFAVHAAILGAVALLAVGLTFRTFDRALGRAR